VCMCVYVCVYVCMRTLASGLTCGEMTPRMETRNGLCPDVVLLR
jgi:hypothetical protein